MKKFLLYMLRWQLSTPILAVVLYLVIDTCGELWSTIIANVVGGLLFFPLDKLIFKQRENNGKSRK